MKKRWLWIVVGLAIAMGIVFRVQHAERRLFWQDETWTALRVSGHSYAGLRALFDDRIHTVADVARFQSYDPREGVAGTVRALADEEPQHAPAFYVIDHYWAAAFGSSIPSLRTPSIIFGVGAIAAIAWLCLELTGMWSVAGSAAALMALSPFFVNYAGQAREYTLWGLLVGIGSALLLRALRGGGFAIWAAYAISMALGLYSDLLMICVLFAHACYVVILYRRDPRALMRFAASAAVASALFVPWIVVCVEHAARIRVAQAWGFNPYPLRLDIEKWIFNLGAVLFDAEYANMRLAPIAGFAILLTAYAAYRVLRDDDVRVRWFVPLLGLVIAAQQILTDVATHGHESTTARYLLPLWFAMLLAVAIWFGRAIGGRSPHAVRRGLLGLCAVLLVEAGSCAVNSSSTVWWDNNDNTPSTTMASAINAGGPSPFIVSEGHWAEVLVMSHYVSPHAEFLLFKHHPPFPIPDRNDAFLLMPSTQTVAAFRRESRYQLVPIDIAPLASEAVLSFHKNVRASQKGLENRVEWQKAAFLFRLERGRVQSAGKLDGIPLIDVRRGALVESRHRVAVCAVSASGRTLLELGNVDVPVFLRSSAKPFIAAAAVRSGAVDAFGFDDRELALMCASHAAEPEHIEGVLSMLRKAGIPASALRCGGEPSALYNNCSGKHAGILAFAKHIGAPLESYLEADNPVQREILALCERVVREALPPERLAVDGCGIPVFATSIRRAAHAFARFATLDDLDARDRDALARVRAAMSAHPWHVAGTGRFDTALILGSRGTIVGKGGAEGVHCSALVAARAGVVLKVVDGNSRAAPPAAIYALERLEVLDAATRDALAAFREPPVRNVAGRVVGSLQTSAEVS